ncbi:hypothetical protein ACI1V7_10530 [Massilia sp. TN1-12]
MPSWESDAMKPRLVAASMVLSAVLSGWACAVPARAAPVVLTKPGVDTVIAQLSETDDGKLCIVGVAVGRRASDPERGVVMLFDPAASRMVWERTVEPPDGAHRVAFKACHADGKTLLLGAEVVPGAGPATREMTVHAYRFDDQGALLGSKEIDTDASRSTVYAIDADAGGVTVAGAARDVAAKTASNAIFFARLDPGLQGASVTRLPTGAYEQGSAARLAGNTLYVAGNFLPASQPEGANTDDHAASKIVGGKYRFSERPIKLKSNGVRAAISSANDIVMLGNDGKTTQLAAIGADGKAREGVQLRGTFCWTADIGADAATVYAVRTECSDPGTPAVLTAIDRRTGAETIVSGVVGEPVKVLVLKSGLAVVARKSDGTLLLQMVGKGGDPDA